MLQGSAQKSRLRCEFPADLSDFFQFTLPYSATGPCRFYWIDPISYAQNALAINEFAAPRWQQQYTATGESLGDTILGQRDLPSEQWWIWLGVGVLAIAWFIFQIGTWACHAFLPRAFSTLRAQRISSMGTFHQSRCKIHAFFFPTYPVKLSHLPPRLNTEGRRFHHSCRGF
jgi:hypothetical protein